MIARLLHIAIGLLIFSQIAAPFLGPFFGPVMIVVIIVCLLAIRW
jgi:hypothetical protein